MEERKGREREKDGGEGGMGGGERREEG